MDGEVHSCCTPTFSSDSGPFVSEVVTGGQHEVEQCLVPAGRFLMGDSHGDAHAFDGEHPVHEVEVPAFSIDATTVTNSDFGAFVDATGYRTEAEVYGSSAVFRLLVEADESDVLGASPGAPWWWSVRGADWRHPHGPKSDIEDRADHPVVQVSWHDAHAYCTWASRRLPTEVEWERASRGGLVGQRFPWGDEIRPDNVWCANIWQGVFPAANTADDGWVSTAPVRTYEPNAYGLWQTVGNVWEWCSDVFSPGTYARRARGGDGPPSDGELRVLRGGSYLCHDSYCNRYRNAARSSNTPDSAMGNAGFRTVS